MGRVASDGKRRYDGGKEEERGGKMIQTWGLQREEP
jgi:hypothetical protein